MTIHKDYPLYLPISIIFIVCLITIICIFSYKVMDLNDQLLTCQPYDSEIKIKWNNGFYPEERILNTNFNISEKQIKILREIDGIQLVMISPYQFRVFKGGLFPWKIIIPRIEKVLLNKQ